MKNLKKLFKKSGKSFTLLVSLLLLLVVTVSGTIAYLNAKTGELKNVFNPSEVTTYVDETVKDNIKSDVSIKNTGDTTAWIRAAIVVTWQDEKGNVYGQLPVNGKDYEMKLNVVDKYGWMKGDDDFYYWYLPVKSQEEDADDCNTGVLIEKCSHKATAPEGYSLTVEIIGSGIQSVPETVFNTEWASSSGFQVQAGKIAAVE